MKRPYYVKHYTKHYMKHYMKHLLRDKRTCLSYFLILLYAILQSAFYPSPPKQVSPYDIYQNLFSSAAITFLLIPLFLLLIEHNAVLFDHSCVILRMGKRGTWWKSRILYLGMDIGIFIAVTNGLALLLSFLPGQPGRLFSMLRMILLSGVLQFIGYAFLGVLFTTGKVLTGKTFIGFIAAYAVIALDYVFLQLSIDISILSRSMFLPADGISWLAHFLYLLFMFAVITAGSYYLVKDMDFLQTD